MAFVSPLAWGLSPRTRCTRPGAQRHVLCMAKKTGRPRTEHDLVTPIRIALTREAGKNVVLRDAIEATWPDAETLDLPCVETVVGPDRDTLPKRLCEGTTDWIVITSPEAASVFIAAWREADLPNLGRIAAVGKATGDILRAVGLVVDFEPSKATGKTLVQEFPEPTGKDEVVLYPASARASRDVVDGLIGKGYSVVRLNTYSTERATLRGQYKMLATGVHIVTFASPSAVKGWVENVGVADDVAVACIGETSATAAREIGFRQVHYPEKPGVEGWISAICEAMKVYDLPSMEKFRR